MESDEANNAPIFVIGAPRCGTTLTAKVLGRHSRIFMPGDCHFFEDIYARRASIGSLDREVAKKEIFQRLATLYGRYNQNEDQERIDQLFADSDIKKELYASFQDYRSIFNAFMGIQLKVSGKVRWGNNNPKDLFHVDEILSFYPDAKFIACVRDPRDFLLSYKGRWKVTTPGHRARLRELYHPVVTSSLWRSSIRQLEGIRMRLNGANIMVSKYEDLVNDPEQVVRRMCTFLDETFEPDMLNVNTHNSSNQEQKAGIFKSSVNRWTRQLSNEEICIAQWLTHNEMARLGYPFVKRRFSIGEVAGIVFSSPFALYRALDANKGKRGPLIPYLAKRVAALIKRT